MTTTPIPIITDSTQIVPAESHRKAARHHEAAAKHHHDAAKQNDFKNIIQLDEECNAVKLPQEVRVASQKLGLRLLKIFDGNIHHPFTKNYTEAVLEHRTNGHYCIAFGLLGYAMKITKKSLLTGFYYNAAVGYISNCVKLIPLGQKDGQKILFELQEVLYQMVKNALQPDREMIGLCCPGFDIRSMQHEQLYSRLYMS